MKHNRNLAVFVLALLTFASVDAQAQTALNAAGAGGQATTSFAGTSFGSPIAFGADWGSVGLGIYGQTLKKSTNSVSGDGSVGVAIGLGDADRYVGLETDVAVANLASYTGNHFGDGGALGFKLHTNLGNGAAFAVGVIGTGRWGTEKNNDRASVYAVVTKAYRVGAESPHALVVSVGVGDEDFQSLNQTTGFGKPGPNAFGSIAFYIAPRVSIVTDYTGRYLNAGLSVAPFRTCPFTVTLGGVNLTNRYSTNPQVAMTLGYGFHF